MSYNQYQQYPQYGYGNQYQQRSNLDWIMVATVNDVEKVTVQPNSKAWVMVQNEPVFALRAADNMGLIQTDLYKFEKYAPVPTQEASTDYVTKNEFQKAIEALTAMIGGNNNESTCE